MSLEPVVVLAGEGMKFAALSLKGGQRLPHALQRRVRVVQHFRAVQRGEIREIRPPFQPLDDGRRIGICHFERGNEGLDRLIGQGGCAAVAKESAVGIAVGIKIERRRERCVHQGRRIAKSRFVHVWAAQGHRQTMVRAFIAWISRKGIGRHMAGGARLSARRRQRLVLEDLLTELCAGRQNRGGTSVAGIDRRGTASARTQRRKRSRHYQACMTQSHSAGSLSNTNKKYNKNDSYSQYESARLSRQTEVPRLLQESFPGCTPGRELCRAIR